MSDQRAQITMSQAEIQDFLVPSRVATLATKGPSGYPHQVVDPVRLRSWDHRKLGIG